MDRLLMQYMLVFTCLTALLPVVNPASAQDESAESFELATTLTIDEPRKTLFRWNIGPDTFVAGEDDGPDTIVTDRPDFTEASSTVGRGRVQLEMGYTYVHDRTGSADFDGHSYPETLFRIGMLAEWFELRVAWNYGNERINDQTGNLSIDGSDDLYLGAKVWLTEQKGFLPELAIIPQMLVPLGSDLSASDQLLPGVNLVYSWELTDRISLAGSTQANRVVDDVEHYHLETAQSATIGVGITDKLGMYTEYFGLYPHSSNDPASGPKNFVNGGFTYLINNNVQFDIRAGGGLNAHAENFFAGAGLSMRF